MKKKLSVVLAFVLVVAMSVAGTYAYLTSQVSVQNTFTVGKVAITMDEADVKTDGTYETDAQNRVYANTYKLIPGHEYIKDPTIHVDADSENCWLFVKVENGISDIETKDKTIEAQMETNGWTAVAGATNVYAYKQIVAAGADVSVFGEFTIAGNANVADYADAEINVTAYAVQADGFDNAAAAWTAAAFASAS